MKNKYLIIAIHFCFMHFGFGQNGLPSTFGAKSIAMGNTGVTMNDIGALLNNQAGLAQLSSFSAMVAAERRFAISDLQSATAGVALPTGGGTFGLSLQYFGFDLYNEQRIGLTYARKLFDHFSIGAQFVVHNTRIEEYGSRWTPAVELGLLYEITEGLSVGAHIFNPARIELLEGEFLPTVLRLGFSYASSDKATFAAEVSKDIDYPVQVRAGFEYRLADPVALRAGIQTAPEKWSFGMGYCLEKHNLVFDLSAAHHQFLGFTPAVSLTYAQKK
jgi:long-subunit fatty acid transport protein